jgi:hypothetical protein
MTKTDKLIVWGVSVYGVLFLWATVTFWLV